jgi:GTP-binding protein
MNMFDLVRLKLAAGDGGDGRVSFRREKFVPKGGPDGGNGAHGGSIYIKGSRHLNTLQNYAGVKEYVAPAGKNGGAQKMEGGAGEDLILEVPIGTTVWLLAENKMSRNRRLHQAREGNVKPGVYFEKFTVPKTGGMPPKRTPDKLKPITEEQIEEEKQMAQRPGALQELIEQENQPQISETPEDFQETAEDQAVLRSESLKNVKLKDLSKIKIFEIMDEEPILICEGGRGGRGNETFKGSTNTTPLEAEYGSFGEKKIVLFELKLLADVGLIGYPNAGKSTLLSIVTRANPKIANYPFTTLEPNLGVMSINDDGSRDLVMADIPGLIEGASQGKGLGFDFLRHVQACRVLLYVLTLEEAVIFDENIPATEKAKMLYEQYQVLKKELQDFDPELINKPTFISLSKQDLYFEDLLAEIKKYFKKQKLDIIPFSAVTQQGVEKLKQELKTVFQDE